MKTGDLESVPQRFRLARGLSGTRQAPLRITIFLAIGLVYASTVVRDAFVLVTRAHPALLGI